MKLVMVLKKNMGSFFFLAVITVSILYGYMNLNYNWQWYRVPAFLFTMENGHLVPGMLIKGLGITLKISTLGLILSLVIGFSTALMRFSSSLVLNILCQVYIEAVRNTPLLIQLFIIYFVISPVTGLTPFVSAVLALSLFEGAYASEIIRSGIETVPRGQWEAAQTLGLGTTGIYLKVILPQVMRQTLPMLAGQSVSLVKDSALVSTIAIYDLTMQGQRIVSETFLTFEIWFTVALCYFSITASLSFLIKRLEDKFEFVE